MGYFYKMFQNEAGRYNSGHPCDIAPELVEFNCPSDKDIRTITAIWCNIMEANLEFFRKCEAKSIQVTMVGYRGNADEPYGLRKFYTIGNIPECVGVMKIIPLSDIDY